MKTYQLISMYGQLIGKPHTSRPAAARPAAAHVRVTGNPHPEICELEYNADELIAVDGIPVETLAAEMGETPEDTRDYWEQKCP